MYKVFGKNRYLPRAVLEVILFGFVELLLIFLVVDLAARGKYGPMSLMLVTTAFVGVFALDMVRRGFKEYPLVITDHHMVCYHQFGKRTVFDRDKISWFKIIRARLVFIHDGWPSAVYVCGLSKAEQEQLSLLLGSRGESAPES